MGGGRLPFLMQVWCAVWVCSELVLAALPRMRRTTRALHTADRKSLVVLLVAAGCGGLAAGFVRQLYWTPTGLPAHVRVPIAASCLFIGTLLRWHAVLSLGRLFTLRVSIAPGHRLVRSGLYRFLRHPSYTGLLLAVGGIAFAFNDWATLVAALAPMVPAIVYRLRIEERALEHAFPDEWRGYCRSTWRLVPWLY
jgi:protein-S-isoprenylcysteine O-methyltransferase